MSCSEHWQGKIDLRTPYQKPGLEFSEFDIMDDRLILVVAFLLSVSLLSQSSSPLLSLRTRKVPSNQDNLGRKNNPLQSENGLLYNLHLHLHLPYLPPLPSIAFGPRRLPFPLCQDPKVRNGHATQLSISLRITRPFCILSLHHLSKGSFIICHRSKNISLVMEDS